ncbi:MAG: hypothetical protein ABI672_11905 [Vicinamibacteria bacterium]
MTGPRDRVQVLALLYFGATAGAWTRRPDVHSIVAKLDFGALPEFVWTLIAVDRRDDHADHTLTFRLKGPGGQQLGSPRHVEIGDFSQTELVVNWGRLLVRDLIHEPGEYLGELLIDADLAATNRLVVKGF